VVEAVLALGSNLGDRAANLRRAVEELTNTGFRLERASSVWETPPYPSGQPPFLNAVVTGETSLSPEELLAAAKAIETRIGRKPTYHWGPRVIDIDILFYGTLQIDLPDLVIPHPLIAERAFVLVPLAEVIRGPLPVLGWTADELLAKLDRTGIELTPHSLTGGQTQG
jgi:2-amino-4-hydroxy-6-hydroxymethyldihydropteridine diphosphokinase